jgi:L-threonylcarbamoyladenylate synthase
MESRIESAEPGGAGIADAVAYLRAGELVAFPTETVYGLGADARRDEAVRKIYEAKGRPSGNPVIVHVGDPGDARKWTRGWPGVAEKLSARFWPGPLTMILPRGGALSPLVSAGRETAAVRCPDHPVARELLRAFDGPVAAPSANRSGFTSPTTAAHVLAEFAGRIPLIVDGGACAIGLESTVIDLSGEVPTVLRPGAITVEMLRGVIGEVRVVVATVGEAESAASPGMHSRHYAPRTAAFRFQRRQWEAVQKWVRESGGIVGLISWDEAIFLGAPAETMRMPNEAGAYGRLLYAALREMDEKQLAAILVLMPETREGMWAAVVDRLERATEILPVIGDGGG